MPVVKQAILAWDRVWQLGRAHALMARGKEYVASAKKGKRSKRRDMGLQGKAWIEEAKTFFNRFGRDH